MADVVVFESPDLMTLEMAAAALDAAHIAHERSAFAGGIELPISRGPWPGPGTVFLIRVAESDAREALAVVGRFVAGSDASAAAVTRSQMP